jgi:translation initiation factor 1 (eIF-1/SUI1)
VEVKDDAALHIVELETTGDSALVEIQAKIHEYGASLVILDGLSLATDDLEWGTFGKFCKGLRMLAKRTRVPILVSHHANRDRKKHTKDSNDALDVALGDTLQRYVTLLLRIVREPKQEEDQEVIVTSRKIREGKRCTFAVNAKPAYNFDQKYTDLEDLGKENFLESPGSIV